MSGELLPTPAPRPWRLPPRAMAIRLFLTAWLLFSLHFATNIVREIYPAVALGDHFSFRLDEYAHLHPDLFEKPGYGWHIGNNPGASMVAAIPYALCRPITDRVVERVRRSRQSSGMEEPPPYDSPWPMAREFYREVWRRGLDVKLGLAAFVMQALCMAPSSALGVVVIFFVLRRVLGSDRAALWLALLYAVGTPVLFRTGFLNHNLMLGHMAFFGFVALWNPGQDGRWPDRARFLFAGLMGGGAVLFDYSGVVFLLVLFAYGAARAWRAGGPGRAWRSAALYAAGTLPPIGLLWLYQWRSFGHPIYPGQHWMPPVEWIELGYQGYGWPQAELLWALAFDHRFGLFVTCPILLLGVWFALRGPDGGRRLPRFEALFLLAAFVALWVFFSGSNYTRLQFNTGIRYLAPILPFLFVPTAAALARLRPLAAYAAALVSVVLAWCLAMVRDVESGLGMLNPLFRVFTEGFQLPALTTLSRLSTGGGEPLVTGVSPLPLFALAAAVLWLIWSPRLARGR